MQASGSGEPPSYTALARETHSRPDGTFVDYHAEELVTQAEMEATQLSNTEGSSGSPSASSAPSRVKQSLSEDMRHEFAATRKAINQLLQTLRPPQASTGQTSDQPQAPTGQPSPPNGI
ncbi:hypothetical protein Bca4012_041890 [Brassica carinata]|uniref:Uncharacterized protein n=1 Tax=Brassica carinata TaxID=52824 RepID=A0A8X7UGK6_BRACI|nr:hypothetical protein Bca52824_060324 [Brassica carinata]